MKKAQSNFYILIASSTLFHMAEQTIMPIFPLYLSNRGASPFELGVIISILPLVTIFSKVPLSLIADKFGRWPIVSLALAGRSVSFLLYSFSPTLSWLYLIRIFQAVNTALFSPAAIAITYEMAPPERRGDFVGRYLTSFGVATMLGPSICSILTRYLDYNSIFLFSATLPSLGLILSSMAYPPWKWRENEEYESRIKYGDISQLSLLKKVAMSSKGLSLSYMRIAFSMANSFITTIFALYATESLNFSPSAIAFLFTVKGVTNMLFRLPSGRLSDRIGRIKPLLIAYSLLALTFFLISEVREFTFLLFTMALFGFSHAMRAVTEWAYLGDSVPREIGGLATAYLSIMFDVGRSVGSIFSGAAYIFISADSIFKLGSLIVSSAIAVIIRLERKDSKSKIF